MSILLTGLSGVGKSFIGQTIVDRLDYCLVNMGNLIQKLSIKKTSLNEQRDIACALIKKAKHNNKIIVDIHSVLVINNTVQSVITDKNIIEMGITKILIIEANELIILNRRQKNIQFRPDRQLESLSKISAMQLIQHANILDLSIKNKIPTLFFNNDNELTPEKFNQILYFIS
jgi:adenylate kinase